RRRLRLFCFPYAGGGSSAYFPWVSEIAPEIEVCPVQLPGREERIRETPFTHMEELVETVASALEPYLDQPFAFYGHSLGGLVGFELARYLRRRGWPEPGQLFVSGCSAPQVPPTDEPLGHLPDAEFLQALRRFNGTSETVLQNADLMQVLLPLLRADFRLYETYTYASEEPFSFPIAAYGGLDDARARREGIEVWKVQTNQQFFFRMYTGDHFFIHTKRKILLQGISQDLVLPSSVGSENSHAPAARAVSQNYCASGIKHIP
ncbi:MAG: thioesterase II family protein, partial [Ktedonobacteraceae bacterium]